MKYEDIMHLPRHISTLHKHMSNLDRAAQFAPFAALSGHEEAVIETARLTSEKLLLDESEKEILDRKLQYLRTILASEPLVKLTYFIQDERKDGGSYVTYEGVIKKIDDYQQCLIFMDQTKVMIKDMISIQSEKLDDMDF